VATTGIEIGLICLAAAAACYAAWRARETGRAIDDVHGSLDLLARRLVRHADLTSARLPDRDSGEYERWPDSPGPTSDPPRA
jgi:hypothetical protein